MVRVSVNLNKAKMKLSQGSVDQGRYAFANQAHPDMNNYVPAKSYDLRNHSSVTLDGRAIVWNEIYARRQFLNQFSNYTTPGTGPRWDLKAEAIHMKDWLKAFVKGAEW